LSNSVVYCNSRMTRLIMGITGGMDIIE